MSHMLQDTITARATAYLTKYGKAPLDVRVHGRTVFGIGPASEELLKYMGGKTISVEEFDKAIREVTQQVGRTLTVTTEPTRASSGREIEVTKYEVAPY